MIAYLETIKENAQFHEIVDFLSRSSIVYALTFLSIMLNITMIAYLETIKENAQFHEIVDFLSRSSIVYALT
nr:hypothetical protein [Tanacetum cinerariifolium]